MKRTAWIASLAVVVLFGAGAALAADPDRWLHVRVEEKCKGGETVRVNVPLALAAALIPMIDDEDLAGGKLRLNGRDITVAQLRALRDAVQKAPDGEYVTVDSPDEHVRVAKSGSLLTIDVTEEKESGETVHIKIPMRVVDALLAGDGEELDLVAALHALGRQGDGEIVNVVDASSTVRVWIDGGAE